MLFVLPVLLLAAAGTYDQALNAYYQAEYEKAIGILTQLPSSARVDSLLGQCWFYQGEYHKASQALEKAAVREPNNSMVWTWLGRSYGRRAETGFPLAAPALATKTREAFEKAVKLDPANTEGIDDLFEFYLDAPPLFGGGIEKARGLVAQITKNDGAEGHFAGARIDERQKQFATAEEHLRQAIALAPRQPGRVIDLAQFLARRGRFDESDQAFAQAAKLEPDAPRLLYARAETWIRAKRNLTQAKELLNRYLQANLTPDDPTRADARRLLKKAEGNQ
jgi:tetratricopeptide (TPR) repeat protein